jgi:predicted nucleic acid-binding protein
MRVVDASVWVSRLIPRDAFHRDSRHWFESVARAGETLVAPAMLVPEVAGAVSRRTGDPDLAHQTVEALVYHPAMRLVTIDRILVKAAADIAGNLGLRGVDAFYAATAFVLSLPLISWDQEHAERAGSIIVVRTPLTDAFPSR